MRAAPCPSPTRVGVIKRVRDLAERCAEQYLDARKELGFPLLQLAVDRLQSTGEPTR
jgi:glycyl-tRNA synthetase alpha subunit